MIILLTSHPSRGRGIEPSACATPRSAFDTTGQGGAVCRPRVTSPTEITAGSRARGRRLIDDGNLP
jgi:hypothetical protein